MAPRRIGERVLDVVDLLADHPGGMPLSEIAREQDLPKSTTHRLLRTLLSRGYVEQLADNEVYRLSIKLPALGFRFIAGTRVLEICQPVLDRLARDTGELVRLAMAHSRGLTWVAKAQGARWGVRYDPDMGSPVVLHATASGRAWLSTMTVEHAVAQVEAAGFKVPDRFGRQKVRDRVDLIAELERTRRRGYGLAVEEGEPGASAIAMPILGVDRRTAVATVSVAGPVARMSAEHIEAIVPKMIQTVDELQALWPIVSALAGNGELN